MIYINGDWVEIKEFKDALRTIEEHMGSEFARKVQALYETDIRADYVKELEMRIEAFEDMLFLDDFE